MWQSANDHLKLFISLIIINYKILIINKLRKKLNKLFTLIIEYCRNSINNDNNNNNKNSNNIIIKYK